LSVPAVRPPLTLDLLPYPLILIRLFLLLLSLLLPCLGLRLRALCHTVLHMPREGIMYITKRPPAHTKPKQAARYLDTPHMVRSFVREVCEEDRWSVACGRNARKRGRERRPPWRWLWAARRNRRRAGSGCWAHGAAEKSKVHASREWGSIQQYDLRRCTYLEVGGVCTQAHVRSRGRVCANAYVRTRV
jgi:hypothetical protein